MDTEQANLSIEMVLGIVRRRAAWIVLCFVLVVAAAYGFSKHQTKKYTATAAVAFNNNQLGQQIAGLPVLSASNLQAQQASNLELVKRGDMVTKTANLLGHGLTADKVRESLTISGQGESSVVVVSSEERSPALAAAIANTYVRQFVKEQQAANRQFFKSALSLVNKQLSELSPDRRFGADGVDLQDRAHTLGLLAKLGYSSVQLAGEALEPAGPTSPKTKRNTILGGVLGLLLGLGVAFLLERLDQRVREPQDLESIYRLPILGVVPKSAKLSRSGRRGKGTVLPPAEAEAFNLIRAHLRFFNVDRDVRTVMIASPVTGEGKTTIACHLAEAAARLGSRVLLLEVDMRHPTFPQQLDIQSGPGLADVLIGAIPVGEAIQSVDLPSLSPGGAWAHSVDVLGAGSVVPPNPGELLESRAMGAVLEQIKSTYDLVVVDTPALNAVSDAFPLLSKVDGVVLVGWVGRSRRDVAERLHQVLASSGAPLLGVIATDPKSSGAAPYAGNSKSSAVAAPANIDTSPQDLAPTAQT